jgi:hypothetical protein
MLNPERRPCTVLIAPSDLLAALERQAGGEAIDVIALSDTEPLRALEIITSRRPDVVALEQLFAATPRGTALIQRVKADPALAHAEIRLLAHDEGTAPAAAVQAPAAPAAPQPLDLRGTRRAPRVRIAGQRDILVDGSQATLIDLSHVGAQVMSASVLRPNQRVRVALTDGEGTIRCAAVVAWAAFEIPPKSGPRYRAGLEFVAADAAALDAYCTRHREA